MKNSNYHNPTNKLIDGDNFDDEDETRERYPFLFDDADNSDMTEAEVVGEKFSNKTRAQDNFDETELHLVKTTTISNEGRCEENRPLEHSVKELQPFFDSLNEPVFEGPNYHYIPELSEELLPRLDFFRYDNFFASRPAYGFYVDQDEKSAPPLPRLFGDFWRTGELAVMFADTGSGKSLLATQIAQSIASGYAIEPFSLDARAQRVVYFDLELSREQFDRRYSNDNEDRPAKFVFHRNLIRNQAHPLAQMDEEFIDETQFIVYSMIELIKFSKAKVVIIDNITWINNASQTGNAAQRIMKWLARIKRQFGLSILVLAHTPKRRINSPLTINDLHGSKMISNFADSVFGIGKTRFGKNLRYLKSVKRRSNDEADLNQVAVFNIEKDECFLGMNFKEFSDERDHIGWLTSTRELERAEMIERAVELQKQGLSQRDIARRLGVSPATVNRGLKEAKG